jgi:hypothetical protein
MWCIVWIVGGGVQCQPGLRIFKETAGSSSLNISESKNHHRCWLFQKPQRINIFHGRTDKEWAIFGWFF